MSRALSIRKNQVAEIWPVFRKYLRIVWPEHMEKVLFQALRGHYQLWLVLHDVDVQGMFVTSVNVKEGSKVVELIYLTGSFTRADFRVIKQAVCAMQEHSNALRVEGIPDFKAPRFLKRLGGHTDDNLIWSN